MEILSRKVSRCSDAITHVGSVVWNGFITMSSNENKVPRLIQKIGTHNGVFHCDEALACYMLKQLPEYREGEIIRTRDPEVLKVCDIVVDVGGEYNPKTNRYDHHQRDFDETLSSVRPDLAKNKFIKLSSAGLVYAHYGLEVISELLKREKITATPQSLSKIFLHVYEGIVEEVDAIDNGVPLYSEGNARYRINTNLSARVGRLNPAWNASESHPSDELFLKAVQLTGIEFKEMVVKAAIEWWPACEIVKKAIENRHKTHASGEIILLEHRCPWKEHLYSIEEEFSLQDKIKFLIFNDGTDSWRVQAIPVQVDSFVCRVFLHKNWRGIRDEKLSETSQISGCIFCHSTGFIGGNKTKEGAILMALKSLEASQIDRE